jgi:hypothetical protein
MGLRPAYWQASENQSSVGAIAAVVNHYLPARFNRVFVSRRYKRPGNFLNNLSRLLGAFHFLGFIIFCVFGAGNPISA